MSEGKHVVIVGLGTGGLFSSRAAQRYNRNTRITVVERRSYDMFSPCGIPYAIEGKVKDFEDLKHSVPVTRGFTKLLRHEALRVDRESKRVEVKNLDAGECHWISYDSLILSTGSRPKVLPIPGARELLGRGVYTCANPEEGKVIREAALKSKRAVVIGGGAIGLELALALRHLGLEVTATKRTPQILGDEVDPDMAEIIGKFIADQGVKNLFGKGIERINGSDRVESVVIAGETIPCDMVIMATGVNPNGKLAEDAGLKTERGAIVVDDHLRTSDPCIYALGDATTYFSGIDGKPAAVALATTAYKQAAVAGVNAAGGDAKYEGTYGTFVTYFGGLEVSCTGFNTSTAEARGFKTVAGRINMKTKPHWMPDAKDISVKIVSDAETGRVLGGQAVGEEGTDWRINIIAMAVKKRMTLQELSTIELAYCPAVSDLNDPLMLAVDVAIRRLESTQRRV